MITGGGVYLISRYQLLLTKEQALHRSEVTHRSIIDSAQSGIIILDGQGIITLWNRAAEQLFGYTTQEAQGQFFYSLVIEQKLHPLIKRGVETFSQTGQSRFIGKTTEIKGYHKAGHSLDIEVTLSSLKLDNKWHCLAMVQDISERTKTQNHLTSTLTELERSNKDLDDFAHIISHDLKAPLRAIGTLASWLAEDYASKLDELALNTLQLIIQRSIRINNLIEAVLEYSQVGKDRKSIKAKRVKINLEQMIQNIIDLLSPLPLHITMDVDSNVKSVYFIEAQLQQILIHLVDNAVRAIDKERGEITITTLKDVKRAKWQFIIKDNGKGIHERHFKKIFEPMQTLQARDVEERIGMGLSIVQKIVSLNQGHIEVESNPGKGSTFSMTLPLNK